ncbi:glycosyltransferase family 2 protein [Vreelandella titanicae]|uniref:Glycosyl transferase, family 2 n=1 Tax=Vreelandella titanicae BH1 TaxID=1204738 RepID=L9UBH9_9GAMM|nr:glycosyltransferase family A protein [Halomonas titanicae]ELY22244.1 Glycosyl transferase, family 2 [Halomonas titanicae BH1]NVE89752.1 glycosyltransferase family 2 protein [Halomonas titanicae]|tara:strand:- start:2341 stop:3159 length:819 start_codon:yes stop_codon:yes gene_type:complete
MNQIDISVIMTVKNGSKYLESSLSSVFSQTYLPKEVVVVNDGSDDDTWEVLKKLRHMAPVQVQLVDTQGVGRARALNLAVNHTRYPWLANIDADDQWLPEKLAQQVATISLFPNVELVVTASQIVYGEGEGELVISRGFSVTPMGCDSFYVNNPINHSSILFSRRFFDEVGGYDEALFRQVDIDLWVRALRKGFIFYQVDLPLTVKRLHEGQSFEVGNRLSYTFNSLKISLKKLRQFKAPFYYFPIAFVKFFYNNIPRSIRRRLKRVSLWKL